MPELPEVETITRQLAPRLVGHTIQRTRLTKPDMLRDVSPPALRRQLSGASILSVTRRAKHAILSLNTGRRLVFKPGMTGQLMHYTRRPSNADRNYDVLSADLDDGTLLVYRDVRRIGSIWLMDERAWERYDGALGPEPLDDTLTLDSFIAQFRGTRQAIKKSLMDQRRIVGIGNIYANEILYDAGISPRCRTSSLRRAEYGAIYRSMRQKLAEAIAAQGTTLRDYRTGTGETGSYQTSLKAYGRGGEACLRCDNTLVTTHDLDNRATTYCRHCQRCRLLSP